MQIINLFSRFSLGGKILFFSGLILTVVCVSLMWYNINNLSSLSRQASVEICRSGSKIIIQQINSALKSKNSKVLEQVLDELNQMKTVRYIVIMDNKGSILSTLNFDVAQSLSFQSTEAGEHFETSLYSSMESVILKDQTLGKCYLGLSPGDVNFTSSESPSNRFIVPAVLWLTGMLGIFALTTLILKPVKNIIKDVRSMAEGNFNIQISVPFDDEFMELANALNMLSKNTKATKQRLDYIMRLLDKREQQLEEEIKQRNLIEEQMGLNYNILNKTSALILVVNSTGGIEYASPSFEHVLGYKPEDLLRVGWWKSVIPNVIDRIKKRSLVAKYARGEQHLNDAPYEQQIRDGSGTIRWILWQDTVGPNQTLISVGHDITERKRNEEQILEQAALLDITSDAIIVRDLEHRILFWNRGAEKVYGWKSTEAIGRTESELIQEENSSGRGIPYTSVIENGYWSGELKQITKEGKKIIIESRWTLMNDSDAKPKSILIVSTDVTEQKQLELQFRRAQRLENIGTLAGGIAHDLNNVLTPISMSIQILQKLHNDEKTQQLLSTLESSAKRGADIVKQVLTFARGSEGERSLLQPKHILREVEKIARETFPRSIQIKSNIASNLWAITGDTTQLHQIVLNLLVNARDAMPDGGTLTFKAENIVLDDLNTKTCLHAKPGSYVAFSIIDTGTGIPLDIIDKIFDPFFTTKEIGKGTGLGLSTVVTIVKSYGGYVTVDTVVGKGTTFVVFIPATNAESSQPRDTIKRLLPSGRGEMIIVVDDELSIREIIKETLEVFGYHVQTAKDGIEALTFIEKDRYKYNLVLTDMMMPNMDGGSLIRTLAKITPDIRIIAMSGITDQEVLNKIKKYRIEAFLSKPIQTDNLLEVIDSVLHTDTKMEKTI
jgi:PAS domain S-box-containing protein